MSYKPKTLIVPEGGTGIVTTTAYTVQTAGTTSTGNWQNVASLGTSTHVLTSNGTTSIPSFQALTSGSGNYYTMNSGSMPAVGDSNTLYWVITTQPTLTISNATKLVIGKTGTINKVYGTFSVSGTLGTTENVTLSLYVNETTDNNVITTGQMSATDNPFSNTSAGVSVNAGDNILIKMTTPVFATNPTTVSMTISFVVD
jgi:hypothetical protein